ncbi:hypothetical protein [Bacillus wiedmannii]|uniref:hypothetical protein n=1 Tax=Bacillus wiedmannii TaxID=1890302 RepID=UPI000B44ADE0|nr:hypothetical protein [Bacillus wiedmannii]OUB81190.1 hypothetical protein BK788_24075 [Bacillus thuringiensis serovar sinensis]
MKKNQVMFCSKQTPFLKRGFGMSFAVAQQTLYNAENNGNILIVDPKSNVSEILKKLENRS